MKSISSIILSACIITLLWEKIPSSNSAAIANCTSSPGSVKYIECVNLHAKDVPQGFDRDIEGLTFMYGEITEFTSNSFKNYPDLLVLTLNGTLVRVKSDNFLDPLKKLVSFTLYQASFPSILGFSYPSSLEFINIIGMDLSSLNITVEKFRVLKHVDLNRNNLTHFPIFNPIYPIETVVVDNNPNIQVSREDIISLCSLKYLGCNTLAKRKFEPTETEAICHCLRLQWFVNYAMIRTNFKEQRCTTETQIENCSLELDNESLEIRKHCTTQLESGGASQPEPSNNWKLWYILGGVVLASVAVVAVSAVSINQWRKSKIEQKDSSTNEDDVTEGEGESVSEESGEEQLPLSEE